MAELDTQTAVTAWAAVLAPPAPTRVDVATIPGAERAARRALRQQIARLERELAGTLISGFPDVSLDARVRGRGGPRLLDLGELERVRDQLADRLADARRAVGERAERHERNRALLERMLLDPKRYRFARIANTDLGEGGCGVWEVRPRLGLIGMLAGWWQVKLSSGCPLAAGSGAARVGRCSLRGPRAAPACA